MILNCPACKTRYLVPDSAIGPTGRSVRCASCRHNWFQEGVLPEPPAPEAELASSEAPAKNADKVAAPSRPIEQTISAPAPPSSPISRAPDQPPPVVPTFVSETSSFAHEPPFKPRRNPAKLWTMAAIAFAVLICAIGGALYLFGPSNLFEKYQMASVDETPLLIELSKKQDRRTLQDGTEYFAASGTIINPTAEEQDVKPMIVVLRDASGRIVYSWKMKAPAKTLAPGARINFNEAKLDVPRAASQLEVGWANTQQE